MFHKKNSKSRPSTVLRIARLLRVHDTINQTEKRIGKIHSSEERKQTTNGRQEERGEEDPPRIPPKPGKERGRKEKDEEREGERGEGEAEARAGTEAQEAGVPLTQGGGANS